MASVSKSVLLGTCLLALGTLAFSGDRERPADNSPTAADSTAQTGSNPDAAGQRTGENAEPPARTAERPPTLIDLSRAAEKRIRRAMQTKIDTTLEETELREFVEFLADQGKFPIHLNEAALHKEGIKVDTPLTDELRDVTIEHALNWTLRPLGATWVIENEVLNVTTEIDAEKRLFTRTYDVSRLLKLSDAIDQSRADTQVIDSNAQGNLVLRGFDYRGEWLVVSLQDATSGPWQEIDGTGGTLSGIGGTLTVRQTQQMHEEVAHLLKSLEAMALGKAKQGSIAARADTYPREEDVNIKAALKKRVSIDYVDNGLSSVAADIAKRHAIRVRIRSIVLVEEGIAADELISLTLNDVSLGSMLHLMLEPLGLTYYVSEGALWITTEIGAEEILYTAVYGVRDLIQPDGGYETLMGVIQQETSGPWMEIDGSGGTINEAEPVSAIVIFQTHKVHQQAAQLLADMRATMAAQPKDERRKPDPDAVVTRVYHLSGMKLADDLLTAVPRFVAPKTWGDGGKAGTIQKVGELLVIRHKVKVHWKIVTFLEQFGYYPNS